MLLLDTSSKEATMLFNSTVYQIGGGELKETTGELNPKATVRVPVTGAPVALVITRYQYEHVIGLNVSTLVGAVFLFNGKTSTNPSQDTGSIKVLFNGDSEMLINNTANTTLYYRYVELV